MRPRALLISLLVALAVGVGAPASALSAPIAVFFEGTITEADDPFGLLDHPIEAGHVFTVSYSIDPDPPASQIGVTCSPASEPYGSRCEYWLWPQWASATLTVDGTVREGTNLSVYVADSRHDIWALRFLAGIDDVAVTLWFEDRTGNRLSNEQLFVNDNLNGWTQVSLGLFWGSVYETPEGPGRSGGAAGTIIPEPTPVALLIPALLGLLGYARLLRHRNGVRLLALLAVVGPPATAWSTPVTVTFPGTIQVVIGEDDTPEPPINPGDPFVVSYTLDPAAAVGHSGCSSLGCAYYGVPVGSFTLRIVVGGAAYTITDPYVSIANAGPGGGRFDFWSLGARYDRDVPSVLVMFIDPSGDRVSGGSFFVNESLEGWLLGQLQINLVQPDVYIRGRLVPEPASFALLLPALVGVIAGARLRRRAPICGSSGLGVLGTRRVGLETKDHNRGVDPPEGRSLRRLLTVATNHQLRAVECR